MYFCRRKVVKDFRRKILRGKQVRILYSTRCCKFQPSEPQHVTVARREDAVSGTSQKTCHIVLLSLREVGGCKRDPNRALRSNVLTEAFCRTLNAEDYAFMELFENYCFMGNIVALAGRFL